MTSGRQYVAPKTDRSAPHQSSLFESGPPLPEGFAYRAGMLSLAEEESLVERIAALPLKPFAFHGYLGNRRVQSFGFRYEYSGRGALRESEPIPGFLLPVRDLAARFAELEPAALQTALVTEYAPGAGIGWHRDKPEFEDVVAFSLLNPCTLRFRRTQGERWKRRSLTVAPGSAYLLRGEARQLWQHSIPAVDQLRYSITFRNLRMPPAPTAQKIL